MKVKEIMTPNVIKIHPNEPVEAAARALAHYNIGALPVCEADGSLLGILTDRDLVTRCMASGRKPGTAVRDVMTGGVISATPDMEANVAAHLMGRQQVRRLPVVDGGRLCGMVTLGDLASSEENILDAADALAEVSTNLSNR